MHADIAERRQDLIALCRRFGVRRLEVFGSAARGADFDPSRSDADFLVEFDRDSGGSPLRQFFGFAEALEETLGRSVDTAYAAIEHERVWRIAHASLPGLRGAIDALFEELGKP